MLSSFQEEQIRKEITFRTTRSSGSGGQNVNKVNSRVELIFDYENSDAFGSIEKTRILEVCKNRINSDKAIVVDCQEDRSQFRNKEIAFARLISILSAAVIPPKLRFKTKKTKASKERRLKSKKQKSEIKRFRSFKPGE